MDIGLYSVVISRAGRDKGRFLAVVKIDENAVYVCDGKERPLCRPKKKFPKHVAPTSYRIGAADTVSDPALIRALASLGGQKKESEV